MRMGEIGQPVREEPWRVPAPPVHEPVKEPSPEPVKQPEPERLYSPLPERFHTWLLLGP